MAFLYVRHAHDESIFLGNLVIYAGGKLILLFSRLLHMSIQRFTRPTALAAFGASAILATTLTAAGVSASYTVAASLVVGAAITGAAFNRRKSSTYTTELDGPTTRDDIKAPIRTAEERAQTRKDVTEAVRIIKERYTLLDEKKPAPRSDAEVARRRRKRRRQQPSQSGIMPPFF